MKISLIFHHLGRQARKRFSEHLSEMPVLRPVAEAVDQCELLDECIGLLTGQSVPIFRCGRKRRFNADRHVLNDQ
jgi:hypothetical protein